jgi:hypothetical protein
MSAPGTKCEFAAPQKEGQVMGVLLTDGERQSVLPLSLINLQFEVAEAGRAIPKQ